jgi:hypothetical protein
MPHDFTHRVTMTETTRKPYPWRRVLTLFGLAFVFTLLGLLVTLWQVQHLGSQWLLGEQHYKVTYILLGEAPSPFQYRPLSYHLAAVAAIGLDTVGLPYALGFLLLRLLQNIGIFAVFWAFWRALGLRSTETLLALSVLLYAMSNTLTDSDLAFDTYGDLLLYGLAGWAILAQRDRLVAVVVVLAAATRETSIFIPLLYGVAVWSQPQRRGYAVMALLAWVGVYGSIRLGYGPRGEIGAYGVLPGLDMIRYNLSRGIETVLNLLATFSLLPILLLVGWRRLPVLLQRWALVLMLPWFGLMLWFGVWAETRLFLVPFAVVLIPAALFALRPRRDTVGDSVLAASPRPE